MERNRAIGLATALLAVVLSLAACSPGSVVNLAVPGGPLATPSGLPTRVPTRQYTPVPTSTPWPLGAQAARTPTGAAARAGSTRTPTLIPFVAALPSPTPAAIAAGADGKAGQGSSAAPPAAAGPALSISVANANVRAGPGLAYPVIGSAAQGRQLRVTGRVPAGDWWQVDYNGAPAWVAASVSTVSPDAARAALVKDLPAVPAQAPAAASVPAAGAPAAPPAPVVAGSAGGGHIAFARGNGDSSDLALLDVATGRVSIVIDHARQPDVRSDGVILFNGTGNGHDDVFSIQPDGSYLTELTSFAEDAYPTWALGRTGIAYFTSATFPYRILVQWVMAPPQGDVTLRVPDIKKQDGFPVTVFGRYPVWLTGDRLAFQGCDGWVNASNCGVWTLYVDGRERFSPFPLTTNPEDRPSDAYGDQLLFASRPAGNWDIYVIGTTPPARKIDPKPAPRQLTSDPAQDVGATFSPDGKRIAWISNRGGAWGIWVMNADGSNQRLLAAVPQGFGPGWDEERLSWGP